MILVLICVRDVSTIYSTLKELSLTSDSSYVMVSIKAAERPILW